MGTFWCYVHGGTLSTVVIQKIKVFCFSHTFSVPWILEQLICWFAPTENHPTHKMYGSVSNICAWKSVESLNGKRFFTSIVKNVLGDFFGLKENHFALQLQGSFILDYQLCRCEEANCRKFGYLIVSYMVIFIKI